MNVESVLHVLDFDLPVRSRPRAFLVLEKQATPTDMFCGSRNFSAKIWI